MIEYVVRVTDHKGRISDSIYRSKNLALEKLAQYGPYYMNTGGKVELFKTEYISGSLRKAEKIYSYAEKIKAIEKLKEQYKLEQKRNIRKEVTV